MLGSTVLQVLYALAGIALVVLLSYHHGFSNRLGRFCGMLIVAYLEFLLRWGGVRRFGFAIRLRIVNASAPALAAAAFLTGISFVTKEFQFRPSGGRKL